MKSIYGKHLKIEIFGTSHGPEIGVIADGLPNNFQIDFQKLENFLKRRAPGQNSFSTARKEADKPIFQSGISPDGFLTGERLKAVIENQNAHSQDYENTQWIPRPSTADYPARIKYGNQVDLRGSGKFSGRLTAPLCIIGGICLQYLEQKGIHVFAHLLSVGSSTDDPFDPVLVSEKEKALLSSRLDFPVLNDNAMLQMKKQIEEVRKEGDSIGGTVECAVLGLPVGLGEHPFDGVENRMAQILFSIPGVKGVSFGSGFEGTLMKGSEHNDPYCLKDGKIVTQQNNSGGILGGMTTGMPLLFKGALKPTPSIYKEQKSVELSTMKETVLQIKGRHDPCIALRAVPVFEAAAAIAILDLLLDEQERTL